MKKRIFSFVLAAMLTIAYATTALAAGETVSIESPFGSISEFSWYKVTISNVTAQGEKSPEVTKSDIDEHFSEYGLTWLEIYESVPVYYCDTQTEVATDGAIRGLFWSGGLDRFEDNTYLYNFDENFEEEFVGGNVTFTAPGEYLMLVFYYLGDPSIFYINIGGATPAAGNTDALKTTDGLVSVIPPAPVEGQDLLYTVQSGETIWGIAYNYYGSMSNATVNKIMAANKAYFDNLAARNKANKTSVPLEMGAVLTLPAKGLINPVTQGSLDQAAGMYLVKGGDTLADIAKAYYGDMMQWRKIYEANKDRVRLVGSSPMIYEKQWLVIPE